MHFVRLSQTAVPTLLLIFINGGLEEAPRLINKFRFRIELRTVVPKPLADHRDVSAASALAKRVHVGV
jgi:hypothetical protein